MQGHKLSVSQKPESSAAKQKIRPRNLKIRLLSDHISTKNQTKSGPKFAILRLKSDLSQKFIFDIEKSTFLRKYSIFKEIFKDFVRFVSKAKRVKIRLFRLFRPKSGSFRQKDDQFRRIFSKRSAIRPRSDKADLLGSTAERHIAYTRAWQLNYK